MVHFLAGLVLSLLPERYRKESYPNSAPGLHLVTAISALIQIGAGLWLFVWRYFAYLEYRIGDLGERALETGRPEALTDRSVQLGMGIVSLMEYALHPLSLILVYFILEGLVRLLGAAITGESIGTLPLVLIGKVQDLMEHRAEVRKFGERVADTVEYGDGTEFDLRIASCRPKPQWGRRLTVFYERKYYQVWKELPGAPPRKFVYLLKRKPEGQDVVQLHSYHPDEVFEKK